MLLATSREGACHTSVRRYDYLNIGKVSVKLTMFNTEPSRTVDDILKGLREPMWKCYIPAHECATIKTREPPIGGFAPYKGPLLRGG